MQKNINMDIDVVITWVDGNDIKHRRKMQPYLKPEDQQIEDIAGATRFANDGEIYYCVASILRFAPFVRKIFIVTDEQTPKKLNEFVAEYFPDNKTALEIIDHKIIFKGYEQYLPTFNSRGLETCLWRIPDLSENFVFFNDDFMLIRPIEPHDWFRDGKVVARGHFKNCFLYSLHKFLKKNIQRKEKKTIFQDTMCNAAKVLKRKRFFRIYHTPLPLKKSVLANYFTQNEAVFTKNISPKFRDEKQFNAQSFFYILAAKQGLCIVQHYKGGGYIYAGNQAESITQSFLDNIHEKPVISCCFASLDQANEANKTLLINWLKNTIKVEW
jgi:hypothetical protein